MASKSSLYGSAEFGDDVARVVKSSTGSRSVRACLCMTRDRAHALNLLKETVASCGRPLYHFTVAGRRKYDPETLWWRATGEGADAAGLLRHSQELRGGGVVVLEDCAPFLRDEGGDIRVRRTLADMMSVEAPGDGLVLIFLESPESEHKLPAILADQFVRLEVSYPRAEELAGIALEEVAADMHRRRSPIDVNRLRAEAQQLATGLAGYTRSAARDAVRDALADERLDFEEAFQRLQSRKKVRLRRELAMNVLDTSEVEDPVGLDNLVDFLKISRDKMRVYGPGRAKGVLLIGPPGTGKTMIARAVGRIVNLPVVEFKISSLMNSLLGETERRFSQAFTTLEAMSPNVVFIDEMEKVFGDSSERDGGTMMRCTGSLLSWLSDNLYPNYIVATCNSLQRMGEIGLTMTRSERFDASFFVDLPSYRARLLMLERWLPQGMPERAAAAEELASITEKFSGADLRSAVKQAAARAEHARAAVTVGLLVEQVERKRMRAIALYDEFQDLRRWGRLYCDPAGPTDD
jgi:SpoVK/Ycf46/Vps4 family AAA+-type ATPase